eukprot:14411357-Ditylum_brightwellii.AAC.1
MNIKTRGSTKGCNNNGKSKPTTSPTKMGKRKPTEDKEEKKKEKNIYSIKIKVKNTPSKREAVLTSTGAKEDVVTPKNNNDGHEDRQKQ